MSVFLAIVLAAATPISAAVDGYVEKFLQTFPTKATEAGRHDWDDRIEDLSRAKRDAWLAFNKDMQTALEAALAKPAVSFDDRLDAEAVLAQIKRERFEHETLRRPERDPLYWTSFIGNATVFLLVRDDLPLARRVDAAARRAESLPALAAQAQATLSATSPSEVPPELCRLAASQAAAAASFYKDGFPRAAPAGDATLRARLEASGRRASESLSALAVFLEDLGRKASGSSRLGPLYAESFRTGTGIDEPVDAILKRAEAELVAKRGETASYGRSVWRAIFAAEPAPADDREVIRRLFDRVERDRDTDDERYIESWKRNVAGLEALVRRARVITLPGPTTLLIARSPSFFVGQSVGGVYPAGPFAPQGKTLLFVPMPPSGASAVDRSTFFREFNRHFNTMIAAHEILPGHYTQLKYAARHPRKVRALFPDGVYVEGWGTFCERLMLDVGWGGPLDRLAHLKKQLENIARTIVDIRVHTLDASKEDVTRLVKDDAFQGDQLASNMWTRAITTSPQITTYSLGYAQVHGAYEAARREKGRAFRLRKFMDGMMELGPVPVARYRERMAGKASTAGDKPRSDVRPAREATEKSLAPMMRNSRSRQGRSAAIPASRTEGQARRFRRSPREPRERPEPSHLLGHSTRVFKDGLRRQARP